VRSRARDRRRRQRARCRQAAARRTDHPLGAGHQRAVRDFTKWDDTPVSLQHFAQSMIRAYKIAMTPPYGPVAISLDAGLQQEPIHENGERLYIPRHVATSPPQGDGNAVREAARLLANAQNPVIVVDRAARTENRIRLLVTLPAARP